MGTLQHYIDKRRATFAKSIQDRPILLEYMKAVRQEGNLCHFNWRQNTLNYTSKAEGEEVELTGGLDSLALPACSPTTPPTFPVCCAPAPRWPRRRGCR